MPSMEAPGRLESQRMEVFINPTTALRIVAIRWVMGERMAKWGCRKTKRSNRKERKSIAKAQGDTTILARSP